jgi:hypothetical protein
MPFYTKSGSRKGQGLCCGCIFRESGSIRRTGKNIYGSCAVRKFTRPDYFREDAADAAATPRFQHPHEEHDPRKEPLRTLKATLIKSWGHTEIERGNRGFLTKRAVFLLKLFG